MEVSPAAAPAAAKPILRPGKFNPPGLAEMPTAERVMEAMKTGDPRETATRQMATFEELMDIIKELSGPREFRGWLPDETKILTEYGAAKYNLGLAVDKASLGLIKADKLSAITRRITTAGLTLDLPDRSSEDSQIQLSARGLRRIAVSNRRARFG